MSNPVITRIFLFNAKDKDKFIIDGKELSLKTSKSSLSFDNLEIHFASSDFKEATQSGLVDAISPIAINSDDLRGDNNFIKLPTYYRKKDVTIALK